MNCQGLAFDQRRAQVKQARLIQKENLATRRKIVNELLFKAIQSYWKWAYQKQVVNIYENSLDLAKDRFRIIKESFSLGDKPAIDTLESLIQIQNRELQLTEAKVNYQNATIELSNFLWYENMVPLEVSENLRPESLVSLWNPAGENPTREVLNNISQFRISRYNCCIYGVRPVFY